MVSLLFGLGEQKYTTIRPCFQELGILLGGCLTEKNYWGSITVNEVDGFMGFHSCN